MDEVSARIGKLEGTVASIEKLISEHKVASLGRDEKIFDKLDDLLRQARITNGRVTKNEIDIQYITKTDGKLDRAFQGAEDWKKTKLKAAGAVLGISAAGGSIGTWITKLLG